MENNKKVRTRVAPSPTGFAHIGTIYQALFDKTYALKNKGEFILRIEDTDQSRFVADAEKAIYEALDWAGFVRDEDPVRGGDYGPYRQSERLELYQKYAKELVDSGHAYYCFCSSHRLEEVRNKQQNEGKPPMYDKHCRSLSKEEVGERLKNNEKYVIRMRVPESEKIVVEDLIRGKIDFDSDTVDDQVLLKSDGFPTYHLAVVVDDHLMEITHVVRGPEWITSFPKHKLLYDFFNWEMPIFVHTPLITNMDGAKLSKRKGHSSVDWFRRKGFLPEALINFISLLGWSHPDQSEIFTFDEFVKVFDLKDISAVSPKFDLQKLEWMNGQYLQNLSDDDFFNRLTNWLEYCINSAYKGATEFETTWMDDDYKLLLSFLTSLQKDKQLMFSHINKERIRKFEDLLPLNEFFIKDKEVEAGLISEMRKGDELKTHIEWFLEKLKEIEWTLENLKALEIEVKEQSNILGWKVLEVFYPIRIAICFDKVSPPLFESIWILGREQVTSRLKNSIDS